MKKILVLLLLVVFMSTMTCVGITEQEYTEEELMQMWQQVISMMREAECYPYVELRQGDTGYEVIFLQARLMQLSYYGKPIARQFGSGTHAAMRMFEKVHKLPINGVASVEDQKLLFSFKAVSNPGTPAGVEAGQTIPPDVGAWPDDSPPGWWPLPNIPFPITPPPIVTIKPGLGDLLDPDKLPDLFTATPHINIIPDLEIPHFVIPTTPPPGPTIHIIPDMEIPEIINPGFDLPSKISPEDLLTDPPMLQPGFEMPHP